MRHEVTANQLFLWNRIKRHARILDGSHAENDGAARGDGDSTLIGLDPNDASAVADEPGYVNVVDDHQALLSVRGAEIKRSGLLRLCLRDPRSPDEKLNAIELVQRECLRPRRARLHRERRFEVFDPCQGTAVAGSTVSPATRALRPSNRRWRNASWRGPKTKSFVVSVPIWRAAASR
jgi:hypothetical protein